MKTTTKTTKPAKGKTQYRVRFVIDPDASFEECNGKGRPLTEDEYAENYFIRAGSKDERIPYDEYLTYYGNPERHVYLQCDVEKRCPCCGEWSYVAGTGGIDFMDDDPELNATDVWISAEEAERLPGYLREVALEDLHEAGYRLPRSVYCQHKGCKAWHQTRDRRYAPAVDERYCADHQPKTTEATP